MRISDWSSDVCSSDLGPDLDSATQGELIATSARLNNALRRLGSGWALFIEAERRPAADYPHSDFPEPLSWLVDEERRAAFEESGHHFESGYHLTLAYLPPETEEHTSELQSLMRISYAVFCLKKKNHETILLTPKYNTDHATSKCLTIQDQHQYI